MAVTVEAEYLSDLSRVRVSFSGAPDNADSVTVERSTDGLNWTTVRGGDVLPSSSPGFIDDYEFAAGVENQYRVSFRDSGPIVMVPEAGAAVTSNNAAVTPALPDDWAEGDGLLLLAANRNPNTTVAVPAGWTYLGGYSSMQMFAKRAEATETAPTLTFVGGASGSDTIAQMTAFKNLDIQPVVIDTGGSDTAAQNMTLPALNVTETEMLNMWWAKKGSSWTSVTDPANFAVIGSTSSTAGSGAGLWWTYTVQGDTDIDFTARTLTVAGGSTAPYLSATAAFRKADFIVQKTVTITPVLDKAWLKNPQRPSLNTGVTVSGISALSRTARSGTFDIIGRTMPVVVSDVASSRKFNLSIMVDSLDEANDLDTRLAAGDALFLQAPESNSVVPTLYFVVSGYSWDKTASRGKRRYFSLDLIEVGAPASTVYGGTIAYMDLPDLYASYNVLASSVSSYFNLMDLVAEANVIVP
jgi:hypothetical protein